MLDAETTRRIDTARDVIEPIFFCNFITFV